MNNIKISRHQKILISIILISIILKLILFFSAYHGDLKQITEPDSKGYYAPAKILLETGHYMNYDGTQHMFFRTPGYPTFIAIIYFLFGYHLSAIIIAQILLSSLLIITAYYIAKQLFSLRVGLLAAFLVATDYLLLGYTYSVLTDMLFALFMGLFYMVGVSLLTEDKSKYLLSFLLGLFLSVATLIRPISYFMIFALVIGLLIFAISQRFEFKKIVLFMFCFIVPNIVLIGGWQIRNYETIGTYQFSGVMGSGGIKNFFPENYRLYGKNDKKIGVKQDMQILAKDPMLTLKYVLKGAKQVLMGSDTVLYAFLGREQDIVNLESIKRQLLSSHFKNAANIFATSSFNWTILASPFFLLSPKLLFLAVLSVFILRKKSSKPLWFAHIFLFCAVLYFLALSSNASGYARFRLPFQLIIDCYAAAGLMFLIKLLRKIKKNSMIQNSKNNLSSEH